MEDTISIDIQEASQVELLYLRHNAPRGMWKMVEIRTGKSRSQVHYQIMQMPNNQDLEIIQAAREILFAVTGLKYELSH
ncbi:hypothetical protein FA048_12645 [Pedobacter polaris]|uniref:Uncharacterized protein n=1 Tax=Pedobacter polaris TaxID=2571273 RepID=A0A4U1CLC4_9SPHI|nr:hypothetical protein [Pedobacter polaris]TKC08006.1 hypothetical protein FA048_12645 [Pedobacter polaris]